MPEHTTCRTLHACCSQVQYRAYLELHATRIMITGFDAFFDVHRSRAETAHHRCTAFPRVACIVPGWLGEGKRVEFSRPLAALICRQSVFAG